MIRARRTTFFAAVLFVAVALFAGGVAMGFWLHLAACPLCIIQRMIYLLVAAFALAGLLLRRGIPNTLAAFAMLGASVLGMFVAGYQSYIQHYPKGIGCVADSPWWEDFVYRAAEISPLMFGVGGVCEDASWKLFGLSIAELSFIAFLGLAAASVFVLTRKR